MKQSEVEGAKVVTWPNFAEVLLAGAMAPYGRTDTPNNILTPSGTDTQAQSDEDDYWDNVPI